MTKKEWQERFREKVDKVHRKNKDKVVLKILKRIDSSKSSMATRSKKQGVVCDVSLEELRELVLQSYGTKCKYCDKILTVKNFVIDHLIPLSKNGPSTLSNLQVICRTSNILKGSLSEENYQLLMETLQTLPEELSKDIRIRLSRGIH